MDLVDGGGTFSAWKMIKGDQQYCPQFGTLENRLV